MKVKAGFKALSLFLSTTLILFFGLGWIIPDLISGKSNSGLALGIILGFFFVGVSIYLFILACKQVKKTKTFKKYFT